MSEGASATAAVAEPAVVSAAPDENLAPAQQQTPQNPEDDEEPELSADLETQDVDAVSAIHLEFCSLLRN